MVTRLHSGTLIHRTRSVTAQASSARSFPAPVERFRKQVREADAVLFGHPEYNFSIAAPMKVLPETRPHYSWRSDRDLVLGQKTRHEPSFHDVI